MSKDFDEDEEEYYPEEEPTADLKKYQYQCYASIEKRYYELLEKMQNSHAVIYKHKYEKLTKEHEQLKKDFAELKEAYDKLISSGGK